NINGKVHGISGRSRVPALQGGASESARCLRFEEARQDVGVGIKQESFVRVQQVSDQPVSAEGDGCSPIAGYCIRSGKARNPSGSPAVIFIVSERQGSVASCGEQTGDGLGHTASVVTGGHAGEVHHHVAVQRGIGESSSGKLLLQQRTA